jgi:hypothetical protein
MVYSKEKENRREIESRRERQQKNNSGDSAEESP